VSIAKIRPVLSWLTTTVAMPVHWARGATMWLMSDFEAALFVAAVTAMVLLAQLV
jgi:hypothetical protein